LTLNPTPLTTTETPERLLDRIQRRDLTLGGLAVAIHHLNHRWWHTAEGERLDRNKGELLCLVHSELSEAMEGERKGLMDDKLRHRPMAEVELADTVIRLFDYAGGFHIDLDRAQSRDLELDHLGRCNRCLSEPKRLTVFLDMTKAEDVRGVPKNKGEALLRIHRAVSRLYDAAEDSAAERAVLLRTLELIFAYASAWGYDLQGAMEEKLSYNIGRVDHTHAARAAAGGKKW
jgi:hypothetical protein